MAFDRWHYVLRIFQMKLTQKKRVRFRADEYAFAYTYAYNNKFTKEIIL